MSSWKPVLIGRFAHPVEAELACSRLQAEGIRARVADANTISIQPYYSALLGGVKLLVDECDAERALQILGEDRSSEAELESADTGATPDTAQRCPQCGSPDFKKTQKAQPLKIFLSWLLLGYPLPFLKKRSACARCGLNCDTPKSTFGG